MSNNNKGNIMNGPRGRMHGGAMFTGPKEKAKNSKDTIIRIWSYMEKKKYSLLIVFILIFFSTTATLLGPFLIIKGIDCMSSGINKVDFKKLGIIIIVMIGIYIISTVLSWIQSYMMIEIAQQCIFEIRKEIFEKIQNLNLKYFDSHPHGETMSRVTNDVENINTTLTQSISQLMSSFIMVIGSMCVMFYLSWKLAILSLFVVPIGMFITGKIINYTRKYFSIQQKELGELNGYIEEIISGEKVIKVFGREEESIKHFEENNRRLNSASIKAQIYSGIIPPFMNVINNISFAVVAAAGGWLVITGSITIGIIAGFLNYSKQFARPISEIANQINMIQSAIAGAERVFEVMDEISEFEEDGKCVLKSIEGNVILDNVEFGYKSDKKILNAV